MTFAQDLVAAKIRGVPCQQLLQFAGTISLDELRSMEEAISSKEGYANIQDFEQGEINEH